MTAVEILSAVSGKVCCACNAQKPFSEFNKSTGSFGLSNKCRACCVLYRIEYRAKNREKLRLADRLHYEKNRAQRLDKSAAYRLANADRVSAAKKACYEKKKDAYKARVRGNQSTPHGRALRLASQSKRHKEKRATDPVFALKRRIYCCISAAFGGKQFTKNSRTHQILGCGWAEFRAHIEKQFLSGMTWENRSEWHLDHIVPLATATTAEEVAALNHFTNFRPLWALDNMLKSDNVTHLI